MAIHLLVNFPAECASITETCFQEVATFCNSEGLCKKLSSYAAGRIVYTFIGNMFSQILSLQSLFSRFCSMK